MDGKTPESGQSSSPNSRANSRSTTAGSRRGRPRAKRRRREPRAVRRLVRGPRRPIPGASPRGMGRSPERPFAIPGVGVRERPRDGAAAAWLRMDPSKVYHDSDLQPPHDYVAFYAWLRMPSRRTQSSTSGRIGSLEWLPGKTVERRERARPARRRPPERLPLHRQQPRRGHRRPSVGRTPLSSTTSRQ